MRKKTSKQREERDAKTAEIEMLIGRGEEAVRLISEYLGDQDGWVRYKAVEALGVVGGDAAMERVRKAHYDTEFNVAVEAIGQIGENRYFPGLFEVMLALQYPDEEMQDIAAGAILDFGIENLAEIYYGITCCEGELQEKSLFMLDSLLQKEGHEKEGALELASDKTVLRGILDAYLIKREMVYLPDEGQANRISQNAENILCRLAGNGRAGALMWGIEKRRKHAAEIVKIFAKTKDFESLVELLKHDNNHVASEAAKALGEHRHEDAVDELILTMRHDVYWSVRDNAILALGKIGGRAAINALMGEIKEQGGGMHKKELYEAIGMCGGKREMRGLLKFIENKELAGCAIDAIRAIASRVYAKRGRGDVKEDILRLAELFGTAEYGQLVHTAILGIVEAEKSRQGMEEGPEEPKPREPSGLGTNEGRARVKLENKGERKNSGERAGIARPKRTHAVKGPEINLLPKRKDRRRLRLAQGQRNIIHA